MQMTMRWYGSKYDTVSLKQIRQTTYVKGVISTLYDKHPDECWPREEIHELKREIEKENLYVAGIETLNVSDAIKIGSANRDRDIDTYIKSLENLGKEGIKIVCYNFMPVFDWTRTELARRRSDGSTVLAYTQDTVDKIEPEKMFATISGDMNGSTMPGWEPERLEHVKELFEMYKDVDEEKLFDNLVYFLKAIMPVCNQYDIKMAIHPDDPAWSVFGLPRIITDEKHIVRLLDAVNDPHNGITFCTGSLGTNPDNNLPAMIKDLRERIYFVHLRNLRLYKENNFEEAAHLSTDGDFDMYKIVSALYDIGFDGPVRPDHGRMIWNEVAMPGYGLYDRALGAAYICGLFEAVEKSRG